MSARPWLLPLTVLFGFSFLFLFAKDSPAPLPCVESSSQSRQAQLSSGDEAAVGFLNTLTSIPHTVPGPRSIDCVAPEEPQFHSQIGQDKFVYETFFKDPLKCDGVVFEIGANDGSVLSNSFFFERFLGWKSFCIEANPEVYDVLIKNRPGCHNFNVAISKEPMKLKFVKAGVLGGLLDTLDKSRVLRVAFKNNKQKMAENTIDVSSLTPNTIVDMFKVQTIDYLSVDVEGAELGVLTAFDFDRIYVKVITVEANPNDKEKNLKVKELLLNSGFNLFKVIEFDEVYINKRFEKERA